MLAEQMTVEIRWDEKAGLRTGCGVRSQVIDVLEAQINKETANEEVKAKIVSISFHATITNLYCVALCSRCTLPRQRFETERCA